MATAPAGHRWGRWLAIGVAAIVASLGAFAEGFNWIGDFQGPCYQKLGPAVIAGAIAGLAAAIGYLLAVRRVRVAVLAALVIGVVGLPAAAGQWIVAGYPTERCQPHGVAVPSDPEPAAPSSPPPVAPADVHRIGVRVVDRVIGGDGEFYDTVTGEPWVPRGANLIRLDPVTPGHDTFVAGHYDAADLDRQLAVMAGLGYNAVRVFLDDDGDDPEVLTSEYYDNVADFLRLARNRGIQVMLTSEVDEIPIESVPWINGHNLQFLAPDGIEVARRFYGGLVDELIARGAPLEAIWAYELRNELFFEATHEPFSLASGEVTTANGRAYSVSDPTERRAMLEDGLIFWADAVRDEIRRHDPEALVTIGFFAPHGPNPIRQGDTRIIETGAVIERSRLDFIDLHLYPALDPYGVGQLLKNFGLVPLAERAAVPPAEKPIVLGEFGAFRHVLPDLESAAAALIGWQVESCGYNFDGWLLWTWDSSDDQPELWHGGDEGGVLNNALSPLRRPDPCAP